MSNPKEQIPVLVAGNLEGLGRLCSLLESQAQPSRSLAQSYLARFKLWAGSLGAHRASGARSLEYRLRDASSIRKHLISLLQELKDMVVDEALPCLHSDQDAGGVSLIETDSVDDELAALFDADSEDGFGSSPKGRSSELDDLLSGIGNVIDCLLRFSVTISNPAPHDHFKSRAGIELTRHFEHYDTLHVRSKYPHMQPKLSARLGRMLTYRRRYFKYREDHHTRLKQGLEGDLDDGASKGLATTVASSLPQELKDSTQTHLAVMNDDRSEISATSYATSTLGQSELRVPPIPKQYVDGPFLCPFCYVFISVDSRHDWKKHVFRDLRPYACLVETCAVDHDFQRRKDWTLHMLQDHWRTWTCPFKCVGAYSSSSDLQDHLYKSHTTELVGQDVVTIVNLSSTADVSRAEGPCPLCGFEIKSSHQYQSHLGNHLEQLALFVLPTHDDNNDEEFDEDKSESSGNTRAALRLVVSEGNLQAVMSLLGNDKTKSENIGAALKVAASRGRLDVVHFLLRTKPLNSSWYDDAISSAEGSRHFAVATLIRKHVTNSKPETLFPSEDSDVETEDTKELLHSAMPTRAEPRVYMEDADEYGNPIDDTKSYAYLSEHSDLGTEETEQLHQLALEQEDEQVDQAVVDYEFRESDWISPEKEGKLADTVKRFLGASSIVDTQGGAEEEKQHFKDEAEHDYTDRLMSHVRASRLPEDEIKAIFDERTINQGLNVPPRPSTPSPAEAKSNPVLEVLEKQWALLQAERKEQEEPTKTTDPEKKLREIAEQTLEIEQLREQLRVQEDAKEKIELLKVSREDTGMKTGRVVRDDKIDKPTESSFPNSSTPRQTNSKRSGPDQIDRKYKSAPQCREDLDGQTNILTAENLRRVSGLPRRRIRSPSVMVETDHGDSAATRNRIDNDDMTIFVKGMGSLTIGNAQMDIKDGAEIAIRTHSSDRNSSGDDDDATVSGPQQQAAPRQRTSIACRSCRERKIRCSGYSQTPDRKCTNCRKTGNKCIFQPVSSSSTTAFVPVSAVPGGVPPGTPLFGAFGQPLPQGGAQPAQPGGMPQPPAGGSQQPYPPSRGRTSSPRRHDASRAETSSRVNNFDAQGQSLKRRASSPPVEEPDLRNASDRGDLLRRPQI